MKAEAMGSLRYQDPTPRWFTAAMFAAALTAIANIAAALTAFAVFAVTSVHGQEIGTLQVSPPVPPVRAMSVEYETIEQIETVRIVEEIETTVDGNTEPKSRRVISETATVKSTAGRLVITGDHEAVNVFDTSFRPVTVSQTSPGVYSIEAPPGSYLVIVDTPTGSKIRPIVIESIGPDLSALADEADRLATQVNDPLTRADLAATLAALSYNLTGAETFQQAAAMVSRAIEGPNGVLARRTRESKRTKNWADDFRRPLQAAVIDAGAAGLPEYLSAVEAIVEGLNRNSTNALNRPAPTPATPLPVYYSTEPIFMPHR